MKRVVFGALFAAIGALSVPSPAGAQPYGYGPGWGGRPPIPGYDDEEMRRRDEWREHRREFRRQQRELAERRAYEAGRRDAGRVPYDAPEPRRWDRDEGRRDEGRRDEERRDEERRPGADGRGGREGPPPWADRWPGGS